MYTSILQAFEGTRNTNWILSHTTPPEQSTVSTEMPQTPFLGGLLSKATDFSPWKDPKSRVKMLLFPCRFCSCGVGRVRTFAERERKYISGTSITWPCLSIISLLSAGLSKMWTRLGCQAWCSGASSLQAKRGRVWFGDVDEKKSDGDPVCICMLCIHACVGVREV